MCPGRELADAAVQRAIVERVFERELDRQRFLVHSRFDLRMREQRLDLGCEREQPRALEVVERLDAEAVACEEERLAARVVDGEREHAAEARDGVFAPVRVGREHGLGVAVGRIAFRRAPDLLAQRCVVVDLAVVDDVQRVARFALEGHRLVPA